MIADTPTRRASYVLGFFCRHPWPLARSRATNLGLSAARPPTLRVCARAVRATRSPRAHGSLPYGQPSAPVGLRIRAYGSPLARSASGRVLSRPTPPTGLLQRYRGRVVSVRHARPAAHTLRVVVRSAALSGLSAYVQSISQRGRQSHPAGVTPTVTASHQRLHPQYRIRHAAAPQEAATGP